MPYSFELASIHPPIHPFVLFIFSKVRYYHPPAPTSICCILYYLHPSGRMVEEKINETDGCIHQSHWMDGFTDTLNGWMYCVIIHLTSWDRWMILYHYLSITLDGWMDVVLNTTNVCRGGWIDIPRYIHFFISQMPINPSIRFMYSLLSTPNPILRPSIRADG